MVSGLAESLRFFRVHLSLRRPHIAAHGTVRNRAIILVRAEVDGIAGWGECPALSDPGYLPETSESAWFALHGKGPLGPMASAALEDARLDAQLRRDGVSMRNWLGSGNTTPPHAEVVSVGSTPTDGTHLLKAKVTPATIGVLREWRERWPERPLAADANGSFPAPESVPSWVDTLNLAYLEQPLSTLDQHAELRARIETPIALDESVQSMADLEAAIALDAMDLLSLKSARVGGLAVAKEMIDVLGSQRLGWFVGGMLESGIGRASAVALAAHPAVCGPSDPGPSENYFERDVCDPITAGDDRRVVVPDGVGIGRVPLDEFLTETSG